MSRLIFVKIIGTPVACKEGLKETWREVADWAADRLKAQYGDRISMQYFDLFDPECPPIPANSQLPVVLVNEIVVSSGGKISIPLIRKKIEELGFIPQNLTL
ncbi:MAG: hypothetical protein ACYDH2_01940 [Anaerolineaceae bacterium]